MVEIRKETAADQASVFEVNKLAFGQDNEARFVDAIRCSDSYVQDLSLVAEKDGEIVGHILFTIQPIAGKDGDFTALMLAPVAVKPGYQRQGIGSKLLTEGLKACKEKGYTAVIVVGHPEYYPKFGFREARALGIEASFPVPDEAFMALELVPGSLKDVSGTIALAPEFKLAM